jgi:ankyrin repeat protein
MGGSKIQDDVVEACDPLSATVCTFINEVKNNNIEKVCKLIMRSFHDIDSFDDEYEFNDYFSDCVNYADLETSELLEKKYENGSTALIVAVELGLNKMVKKLVEYGNVKLFTKNDLGVDALTIARNKNNQYLIDYLSDRQSHALFDADSVEEFREILDSGSDQVDINKQSKYIYYYYTENPQTLVLKNFTVLLIAIYGDNRCNDDIRLLGYNIDIWTGMFEKIKLYVEYGANVNMVDNRGNSVLLYTVKNFLYYITDINTYSDRISMMLEIAKFLLDNGANMYLKNEEGYDALTLSTHASNYTFTYSTDSSEEHVKRRYINYMKDKMFQLLKKY